MNDEFDKIFRMMDEIFGQNLGGHSNNITSTGNSSNYERIIDKDYIYYTFELPDVEKDSIDIKPTEDTIFISIFRDGYDNDHTIKLPYLIIPKETKVTFKNGILDISVKIDKEKNDRIEIQG